MPAPSPYAVPLPHNLPRQLRSVPWAEQTLAEVQQNLLDPHVPIVSVVGPAGIGKSAIALEAAHRLLAQGAFHGGIFWLDCTHTPTVDGMIETMRAAISLPRSLSVHQRVLAHLHSHPCLLIFDGYDAVTPDMEVLAFLAQLPPPTKALVTSRERVGLLGHERVFALTEAPGRAGAAGLELSLTRQGETGYAVSVNGEFSHHCEIAEVMPTRERSREGLRRATRRYGQRLFRILFPQHSLARQALARTPQASESGGTVLIVAEDPEAQAVPWEYLHDSDDYLALRYHLLRGIPGERRKGYGTEMAAEALYLVAVPSDPLVLRDAGGRMAPVTELSVRQELDHLKTALRQVEAPYRAFIVTPPTLDGLHAALAPRGRQTIVHFIGHGMAKELGAVLLFEDETGAGRPVTAVEFGQRVKGYAYLVVLNACESATSLATPISNLAYTLALEGVPYTLGMQFSVPDAAAVTLSRFFYRFLAAGHPVEEALRQARLALLSLDELGTECEYAMGIPVLYTSLARGFARFRTDLGQPLIEEVGRRQEFDAEVAKAFTFLGRRAELVEIGRRLKEGARVLTLAGPGGIGKSALAREAAARFAWRFPNGILGLSLEHMPAKENFVARLARWLLGQHADGLSPDAIEREAVAAFKGSQMLLVLDNYETLLGGLEASENEVRHKARALGQFIRHLVEGKSVMMLTTRDRPTGLPGEGHPLEVPDLDLLAAVQLFRDHAAERWQAADGAVLNALQIMSQQGDSLERLPPALEEERLIRLLRLVACHPLAIELLAKAYAEGHESMAQLVDAWPNRLQVARDRYRDEGQRHATLAACYEYSYQALPPELKDLFLKLTIFRAPFLPQFMEAVFSQPEAKKVLNLLYRKSLLQRYELRYELSDDLVFYFFHPMARWFAEQKARNVDLGGVRDTFGTVYQRFAAEIYDKLDPVNSLVARVVMPDLKRAAGFLPEREQSSLDFHLGWLLRVFGEVHQAIEMYDRSLAICEQVGDLQGKGFTLHAIAGIHQIRGELEQALKLYQQALTIHEQVGNLQAKGAAVHAIAGIHEQRGELEQALKLYRQALVIHEQVGDLRGKGATLYAIAGIHRVRGEWEQALGLYQQSLGLDEQLGDLRGKGATLHAIAGIHRVRGELEQALGLYQQAMAICEQVGDLQGKGATLAMRGQLLARAGEHERALRDFIEALQIFDMIGAGDVEQVRKVIRDFRGRVGEEGFLALWRKVTQQAELPDWLQDSRTGELHRLLDLAERHEAEKKWHAAGESLRQALAFFDSRQIPANEQQQYAETALRLGACLRQDGQWGAALEPLQKAFQTFKHLNDFQGQGRAYLELARAYHAMQSYALAILYYKDATRLFKRGGDIAAAAAAQEEAGSLQVYLRAFPEAMRDLEEAARLYAQADLPSRVAMVQQSLEMARQAQE